MCHTGRNNVCCDLRRVLKVCAGEISPAPDPSAAALISGKRHADDFRATAVSAEESSATVFGRSDLEAHARAQFADIIATATTQAV